MGHRSNLAAPHRFGEAVFLELGVGDFAAREVAILAINAPQPAAVIPRARPEVDALIGQGRTFGASRAACEGISPVTSICGSDDIVMPNWSIHFSSMCCGNPGLGGRTSVQLLSRRSHPAGWPASAFLVPVGLEYDHGRCWAGRSAELPVRPHRDARVALQYTVQAGIRQRR